MHWLVLENSSLRKPGDIINATSRVKIGVLALGTCVDTENNALLRKYNIPRDKVEYVVLPDPQQEQALRQGLIDIAILHPPFFTAAESHGGVRILTTSKEAFGSAGGMTFLMFSKDFIKNDPETVKRFIRGYKNAEKWSNANRKEAADITSRAIGLDNSTVHYYSDNGEVNVSQVQFWIDSLVKDGVIKPGEYRPCDLYIDEFNDTWHS
jgi:ABC-type nitrate/sulfonate/bicarbonate transport system substrate-binding protein